MRILLYVICSLLVSKGYSQKYIEIPESAIDSLRFNNVKEGLSKFNFDDLTTTNDSLRIRIWMRHHIVDLKYDDDISVQLTGWIYPYLSKGKPFIHTRTFDFATCKTLYDSLIFYNVADLEDEQFIGIDGTNYMFEISTRNEYRFYSYWSPTLTRSPNSRNAVKLLNSIHNILNLNKSEYAFTSILEPGIYQWGLSTFDIDHFVPEQVKKSTLYEFVERKIKEEFGLNRQTRHTEFPTIVLDNKRVFLKDLNNYEYSQIDEVKLYKNDNASALFGWQSKNGVILIFTK